MLQLLMGHLLRERRAHAGAMGVLDALPAEQRRSILWRDVAPLRFATPSGFAAQQPMLSSRQFPPVCSRRGCVVARSRREV